jgi:hypothetical protein
MSSICFAVGVGIPPHVSVVSGRVSPPPVGRQGPVQRQGDRRRGVLVPGVPRIVRQRAHLHGESLQQDVINVRCRCGSVECYLHIFLCWSENSFLNNHVYYTSKKNDLCGRATGLVAKTHGVSRPAGFEPPSRIRIQILSSRRHSAAGYIGLTYRHRRCQSRPPIKTAPRWRILIKNMIFVPIFQETRMHLQMSNKIFCTHILHCLRSTKKCTAVLRV